jgi:hypothetical protein
MEVSNSVFNMDETLIHCVDDIETEDPDIIIPIDFPDEEELVNVNPSTSHEHILGRSEH